MGDSALNALRTFGPTVVANAVPGGVVAFYLAQNFFYLPLALGARPIAVAFLPRLSRLAQAGRLAELRSELVGAGRVVAFLVVPAAAVYLALSLPIARAAAFGQLATSHGVELVAVSLASVSVGLLGDAAFILATNVSYALGDAHTPLRAMGLRTAVALAGMGAAVAVRGDIATLVALGVAITVSDLVGAGALTRWVLVRLPGDGLRVWPAVRRALGASALMLVPAGGLALLLSSADRRGSFAAVATMVAIGAAGLATYVALQRRWRSPELAFVLTGFRAAEPLPPAPGRAA
jgi:putative peptidoglycan lipid II flippase